MLLCRNKAGLASAENRQPPLSGERSPQQGCFSARCQRCVSRAIHGDPRRFMQIHADVTAGARRHPCASCCGAAARFGFHGIPSRYERIFILMGRGRGVRLINQEIDVHIILKLNPEHVTRVPSIRSGNRAHIQAGNSPVEVRKTISPSSAGGFRAARTLLFSFDRLNKVLFKL